MASWMAWPVDSSPLIDRVVLVRVSDGVQLLNQKGKTLRSSSLDPPGQHHANINRLIAFLFYSHLSWSFDHFFQPLACSWIEKALGGTTALLLSNSVSNGMFGYLNLVRARMQTGSGKVSNICFIFSVASWICGSHQHG